MKRLPIEIILYEIIPYTYHLHPPELREDMLHFIRTKKEIEDSYFRYWQFEMNGYENEYMDWLSNNILFFFNDYNPSNDNGYTSLIYEIFRRYHPLSKLTYTDIYHYIHVVFYNMNNSSKQVKFIWGLLTIAERERFLDEMAA